jgi:hypothetical protein
MMHTVELHGANGQLRLAASTPEVKVERDHKHGGCRAHRPCVDRDHFSTFTGPMLTFHRDTIDESYDFSLGEVSFNLSRCNCRLATYFSNEWRKWREVSSVRGNSEDLNLTKIQLLQQSYQEELLAAARECCPCDPANREVIELD